VTGERGRRGVVLVVVLIFVLLLVSSVATFLRRATVDSKVVRHREDAARAEALARGGVRLATALLLEDLLEEQASGIPVSNLGSVWARASEQAFEVDPDAWLRLHVEDAGARLNLNALPVEGEFRDDAEIFLTELLRRVVEAMPGRPEEKAYDVQELARNLVDWLDPDEVRVSGGLEDEAYQAQDPPYRAANRPLLSVDELRLVEGFDGPLVEALEPYVGVFPLMGGGGINPNTAPGWVLGLLFHSEGTEKRLASQDDVADLVRRREDLLICPEEGGPGGSAEDAGGRGCTTLLAEGFEGVFPEPRYHADVFYVRAEARVGEVQRRLDAVIDRRDPQEMRRLAWRMQ
jgi:general secretion pathway protein K